MFLHVSSMAAIPPLYGSASQNHGLHPMAAASPLLLPGTGRSTEASPGPVSFSFPTIGWMAVLARTSWSYCLMAHSFDATLKSDSIFRMTSLSEGSSGNFSFALLDTLGSVYGLL
jgi:hypothetical protein